MKDPRSLSHRVATLPGLAVLLACAGCGAPAARDGLAPAVGAAIARGDFQRELLLTGELQAVRSIDIKGPQTSLFQLRIQYLAEEGSVVREGDTVVEFDNSSLIDQVRSLETQILDAETQIVSKRAELASALKDLEIELAEREFAHGTTRLDASVDPEILSRKDYAERQLALTKAEHELTDTRERIELTRERGKAEMEVLEVNRDKLRKDMLSAEADRERLTIQAPSTGLVVYETRQGTTLRFQAGDSCWPGQSVVKLPDLSEMQVEFSVNEVDAPLLAPGMELRVQVDAFPGRDLVGRIVQVPSMAVKRTDESKIAIFRVRASLSETWAGEMKPGMSAMGRVVVGGDPDVPLVARDAVVFDGREYRLRAVDGTPGERIEPIDRNATHYRISEQEYARLTGSDAVSQRAELGSRS